MIYLAAFFKEILRLSPVFVLADVAVHIMLALAIILFVVQNIAHYESDYTPITKKGGALKADRPRADSNATLVPGQAKKPENVKGNIDSPTQTPVIGPHNASIAIRKTARRLSGGSVKHNSDESSTPEMPNVELTPRPKASPISPTPTALTATRTCSLATIPGPPLLESLVHISQAMNASAHGSSSGTVKSAQLTPSKGVGQGVLDAWHKIVA